MYWLLRDAFGHRTRRDATRLGMTDEPSLPGRRVAAATPYGKRDLGQLRGLAGAGFAADHKHLMLAQRLHDLVAPRADRQGLRELDAQSRGINGRRHNELSTQLQCAAGPLPKRDSTAGRSFVMSGPDAAMLRP